MTKYIVLGALALAYGSAFLLTKVAVEEASALELVAGRVIIGAGIVSAAIVWRSKAVRITPALVGAGVVLGLADNVVPFILIAWAHTRIDSGVASVLISTMPLFTALFTAAFLGDERISGQRIVGLFAGFSGVAVLTGRDAFAFSGDALGYLAIVGAAAAYAIGTVYARRLLRTEDALTVSGLQLVAGAAMASMLLVGVEGVPSYALSTKAWLSVVALGVFPTGLATIGFMWFVGRWGSVSGSLVTYLIPIVGLTLGWLVLDEQIGVHMIAGFALIVAGVTTVMRPQTGTQITPQIERVETPAAVTRPAIQEA